MPVFRFIIEGSDFELPMKHEDGDGQSVTGFFTTRSVRARNMDAAQASVLRSLSHEWVDHAPQLSVLDAWKVSMIDFRRVPNAGHAFFSDEESKYGAASIEAEVAHAPKNAVIWQLARLDTADD